MFHAALNVPFDDVSRTSDVALNGKLEQKPVVIDDWLAAKTLGQHMVTKKSVEDRRQCRHQRRRIAGRDDRLMELPVVSNPVDCPRHVAGKELAFGGSQPVMGGDDAPFPFKISRGEGKADCMRFKNDPEVGELEKFSARRRADFKATLPLGDNEVFRGQAAQNFTQRGNADGIALLCLLQLDLGPGGNLPDMISSRICRKTTSLTVSAGSWSCLSMAFPGFAEMSSVLVDLKLEEERPDHFYFSVPLASACSTPPWICSTSTRLAVSASRRSAASKSC